MRKPCITWGLVLGLLLLSSPAGYGEGAQKVNLNTANAEQLDRLPGVGPATAERILNYRDKNGPFKRGEDLMNVRGIGEKKFLKLRDHVTVGTKAPPQTPKGRP